MSELDFEGYTMSENELRLVEPEDLYRFKYLLNASLSPDGLYAITRGSFSNRERLAAGRRNASRVARMGLSRLRRARCAAIAATGEACAGRGLHNPRSNG